MQENNPQNPELDFTEFYESLETDEKTALKRILCENLDISESTFNRKKNKGLRFTKLEREKVKETVLNLYQKEVKFSVFTKTKELG